MKKTRPCANPLCGCRSAEFTCSLRCGPLDVRQSARCHCGHEACAPSTHAAARPAADDLYPAVLDRFRAERRAAAGGRR